MRYISLFGLECSILTEEWLFDMKYDLERMIFLVCTVVLWPSLMGFDVVCVSKVKNHI